MHHDTPLISTIVAGLVLAFIFGMIANRFRMPPLVGYLLAGVLVGPHTPGFVADQALGAELAELGVILLMFGVGLHFSLKDLMSVRTLAIPGAVAQIALATLLGLGLGLLMGWSLGAGLLFGLALSVASTVVLLKALQDKRLIETERGRIAVGWLIVEDLAMVLALVLIPAIASLGGGEEIIHDPFVSFVERLIGGQVGIWGVLALTIVKVAAFVGFMLIVGRRLIPWALHATAHTGSRELFRLAVLAIALGVALGSAVLFGVSLALGAFFAGMILSESELSHRAAQETLPLRDAFAVLFFVSVGMLFDPSIIITNPLPVLATVFIIVIGKSLAAFGIVLLFKRPVATALTISASLAQIGEFSFILASLGVSLAILPAEGQDLILAGALISIVLNPAVFWAVDLVKPRFEAKAAQHRAARMEREGVRIEPGETLAAANGPLTSDAPGEPGLDSGAPGEDDDVPAPSAQTGHTVLVGFGRVGRVVGEGLHAARAPLVVIEDSDHAIAAARAAGIEVVVGNAASADVLRLANLGAAQCLMIAIPNGFEAGTVCEVGRKLTPSIRIIARAHSDEEEAHLRGLGADNVIMGEREIGLGMLAWLRGERGADSAVASTPAEPKLPPAGNILHDVAPASVLAEIVPLEPAAAIAPVQSPVVELDEAVTADEEARIEQALAQEIPGIETLEPDDIEADLALDQAERLPVVDDEDSLPPEIDAVQGTSQDEDPAAAAPEGLGVTPDVGEAPAAIDEIVVPVAPQSEPAQAIVEQTSIVEADVVPAAAEAGSLKDSLSHEEARAEGEPQKPVVAEIVVVEPAPEAEESDIPPATEPDAGDAAPEPEPERLNIVPPVVPEPKN